MHIHAGPVSAGSTMSGIILLTGTALILTGLWHRDRERLSMGLFIIGAVLVVAAGVIAAPGLLQAP